MYDIEGSLEQTQTQSSDTSHPDSGQLGCRALLFAAIKTGSSVHFGNQQVPDKPAGNFKSVRFRLMCTGWTI